MLSAMPRFPDEELDDDGFVRLGSAAPLQVFNKSDGGLNLDGTCDVEAFQLQEDVVAIGKSAQAIEQITKDDLQWQLDDHSPTSLCIMTRLLSWDHLRWALVCTAHNLTKLARAA